MSLRGLPGHALMHAHQLQYSSTAREDPFTYLRRFGIEAGDAVLCYLGHTDLDTLCCAVYQEPLRAIARRERPEALASMLAHGLNPLLEPLRDLEAEPVLYGCLCHDEIKRHAARALGLRYVRCGACGGTEGEIVEAGPEAD